MQRLLAQGRTDTRFLKPGSESFVDLLNTFRGPVFGYNDVVLSPPKSVSSKYVDDPEGLTRVTVTAAKGFKARGDIDITYRRLDLGKYLSHYHQPVYLLYSQGDTPAKVQAFLKEKGKVALSLTEFSVGPILSDPEDPDAWSVRVTPVAAHYVWAAPVALTLVPSNHLGVALPNVLLSGFEDPQPCVSDAFTCEETHYRKDSGCGCGGDCDCQDCLDG